MCLKAIPYRARFACYPTRRSQSMIEMFWQDLQDRLISIETRLLYLREHDPRQALSEILQKRGSAWESYVIEGFRHFPWMKSRGLSGPDGVGKLFVEYSAAIDSLVAMWRYPSLALLARPASYEERFQTIMRWLVADT